MKLFMSARLAERREKKDSEGANAALRVRFNQLQEKGLNRREWVETPWDSVDMRQALNTAGAPPFIRPVPRPIGLLHVDVRQGLRHWAFPSPYQDERSGRGIRMQYPRQSGTLRFCDDRQMGKDPMTLHMGWEVGNTSMVAKYGMLMCSFLVVT